MNNNALNFNSPIPLYQQLYEQLKTEITEGRLQPGEKMPTELQLIDLYNVSRITVRKALDMLTEDNLVIKRSGKGSFVTPPKLHENIYGSQSFTITCQLNNLESYTTLLSWEIRPATSYDLEQLQLTPGSNIIFVSRLRHADNTPIMIEKTYLKCDEFKYILDENLSETSLYALIDKHTSESQRKILRTIEISTANTEQAKLLQLNKGAPLLLCNEIVTTLSGNPLFRIRQFIAGERVRFITTT